MQSHLCNSAVFGKAAYISFIGQIGWMLLMLKPEQNITLSYPCSDDGDKKHKSSQKLVDAP